MSDRPQDLLTAAQAAEMLAIRPSSVCTIARRGALAVVRLRSNRFGYPLEAVLTYAENRPRAKHHEMPIEIRAWGRRNRPVEHTDLMTVAEAADVLRVTAPAVRGLIRAGRLPCYQRDPCKQGLRITIPTYYVYALLRQPRYQDRRAAAARTSRAGSAMTTGWPEMGLGPVPRSGPTVSYDHDYGGWYTTRQAANALGISVNAVLGLRRRGRLEGGSRTADLDEYLKACGRPLFFRKRDVHALMQDPGYRHHHGRSRRPPDPKRRAAGEVAEAERWERYLREYLEYARRHPIREPWLPLL